MMDSPGELLANSSETCEVFKTSQVERAVGKLVKDL